MVPLGHAQRHQDGKNMKKLGIAAAILLVALLMTGVVSALDTAQTTDGQPIKVRTMHLDNVTQSGDYWMIQGSELKTVTTSDEQIHTDNWTKIGTIRVDDLNTPNLMNIKIGSIHNSSLKGKSGSVGPGYADLWGPFTWNAGYPASVSATWTPQNQGVYLGIYDMANPSWTYVGLKTGGSGTYSRSVPYTSSQWTYAIVNPSSNTATVYYNLN